MVEEGIKVSNEFKWETQIVFGLIILGIIIGAMLGYTGAVIGSNTSFSGEDKNFLVDLAYQTNHCERLGLVSKILPQTVDFNGEQIVYGVPICVEYVNNNGGLNE